jgi:hypothetical protein
LAATTAVYPGVAEPSLALSFLLAYLLGLLVVKLISQVLPAQ